MKMREINLNVLSGCEGCRKDCNWRAKTTGMKVKAKAYRCNSK